ncbi:MAG: hypothetical protein KDA41_14290 [Planctomycetales bacterium]|nr:hypothetical protein [Planctomycetales bacterium]
MACVWKVSDGLAQLDAPGFSGCVLLDKPWQGLHGIHCRGRAADGLWLFQTPEPAPQSGAEDQTEILDWYVRQSDLVVTYAASDAWPVQTELQWRAAEAGEDKASVCIDLLVSLQTDLLESDPTLHVGCELPPGELLHLDDAAAGRFVPVEEGEAAFTRTSADAAGLLLLRPNDGAESLALAIHPKDFQRLTASGAPANGWRLGAELFGPPLEKGVIRRGWLRAAFTARSDDERQALEFYNDLAHAAPPLAT